MQRKPFIHYNSLSTLILKTLFTIFILFITEIQVSKAQDDPFERLKKAAEKSPVEKSELPKVTITRSYPHWKANTRDPIPFKPFELIDSNGNKIPPGQKITLKSGTQITAKEYVDRLNEVEQKLNTTGYTLRSETPVEVSQTVTSNEELEAKVAAFPKPIGEMRRGENLKSFMNEEKIIGSLTLKPIHRYSGTEKKELDKYNFNLTGDKIIATRVNRRLYPTGLDDGKYEKVKPLKVINNTDTKDWSLGNPSTFQAGIQGSITRYARIYPFNPRYPEKSMSEFKAAASGKVYGSLFDNSMELLNASAEFYAPADTSKKMTAKLQVQAAGITILNISQSYAQYKNFSERVARIFDKSFPIEIPIGLGIDFKGKIGLRGEAGYEYGASLYRTFVGVQGKPLANIQGYAEAGIEFLDFIGGGIGGKLNFIKGELELQAFAGIWSQNAEQIVLAVSYYFGYDLEILSGQLYCYVEACLPYAGCWQPVEHTFFNWKGFKQSGTIAEGSAAFVLGNIKKYDNPFNNDRPRNGN